MNRKLLEELESLLKEYDKVLLISTSNKDKKSRWERLLNAETFINCEKKILVLVTEDTEFPESSRHSCLKITEDAARKLKSLYFLYEFSDRFKLLSNEESYGEIWNYVDTEIMTEEEAFQAILH